LTIDQLLGAEVVTADGRVARGRRRRHPDPFWAIRGGADTTSASSPASTYRQHPVDHGHRRDARASRARPETIATLVATVGGRGRRSSTVITPPFLRSRSSDYRCLHYFRRHRSAIACFPSLRRSSVLIRGTQLDPPASG
jgi:hypothetical protein